MVGSWQLSHISSLVYRTHLLNVGQGSEEHSIFDEVCVLMRCPPHRQRHCGEDIRSPLLCAKPSSPLGRAQSDFVMLQNCCLQVSRSRPLSSRRELCHSARDWT